MNAGLDSLERDVNIQNVGMIMIVKMVCVILLIIHVTVILDIQELIAPFSKMHVKVIKSDSEIVVIAAVVLGNFSIH